MTPNDFLGQLNQLPPDTPITAQHLVSILSILGSANNEPLPPQKTKYSELDREDTITEEELAQWINKNIQTLRNWRVDGKGPKFIKDLRSVNYRVGTVIDWIKSREVQSTTQADTLKFGSVFPTIYINEIATQFFETIRENEDDYLETNFTGYQTIWAEENSMASLYLTSHEQHEEADKIIADLLNLLSNGADLNELQTVLIGSHEHSINLSHLVAVNTLEHQQYTALVNDLYSNGLNFHALDSNGKTSLQLAEEAGNTHLLNMINSFDLYTKLQSKIPKV